MTTSDPAEARDASGEDELRRLQEELAGTDPAVVVANHCYGLFELAAVYLSTQPPRLEAARTAIDALSSVVEALGDRLGESAAPLAEATAQLRLGWVQISASAEEQAQG